MSGYTMNSSRRIRLSQFDHGIKLIFTIKKDGMIETLQGASILFKMKNIAEGMEIVRNCTITDAEIGECEYVLTSEDLSVVGSYITEVETTFNNGVILSQDNPIIIAVTQEMISD